jgi:hypothetical protein
LLIGLLTALAVALAVMADDRRAGRGAAGLVLAALAALSLLAGAGTLEPARLARIGMTAAVSPWFLEASLSLLVAGLLVAVEGSRSLLVGLVGAGVAGTLFPVLRAISLPRFGGLAFLFLVCLYGLALAARAVRQRLGPVPSGEVPPGAAAAAAPRPATPAFLAGTVALLSPWAWLMFGASAAAFGGALALPLRRAQRLLVGLSGLMVLGAGAAVAMGPRTVPDPAATSANLLSVSRSIVIAGLILLPSSVALAAWPWHRLAPGLVLAPAALALVGRYAAAAAPMGLIWWLPAVLPVALAGVFYALLRGVPIVVLMSFSWAGLWIGTPESRLGAAVLAGAGLSLALLPVSPKEGWRRVVARIFWVAGGVGMVLVLWGGLTVQVVYTAMLAILTAVGLLAPRGVAVTKANS